MKFDYDTFTVLDIPSPIAKQIMAIRERHHDWFLKSFPIEITLIGSSGVGVFDLSQDPEEAFATLDAIAVETVPIQASFGEVLRFPNTDIFVHTLQDEEPFRALHERIAKSGLRFKPSPFPYKPHCTIRRRSPISKDEVAELLSLRISESFVLDTMSVYMLDKLPMSLLHRVKLAGKRDAAKIGSSRQRLCR
jgi:2'-5' RNA ligase